MKTVFFVYMGLTIASIIVFVVLLVDIMKRRSMSGAKELIVIFLCHVFSLFCSVLSFYHESPEGKIFWQEMKFLALPFLFPHFLLLSLTYIQKAELVSKRNRLILMVLPAITVFMVWSNSFHHLFRKSLTVEVYGGISYVATSSGIWYSVYLSYSYLMIIISAAILVIEIFKRTSVYRKSLYAMLAVFTSLAISNLLIVAYGYNDYVETSLLSFTIAIFFMYYLALRYRNSYLVAYLRRLAMKEYKNPVLIFNDFGQLVSENESARTKIGLSTSGNVTVNELISQIGMTSEITAEDSLDELELGLTGSVGDYYEISDKLLYDKNKAAGRVIVFNNITTMKSAVSRLEYITTHDYLTGVGNRHSFIMKLEEWDKAENLPLCIVSLGVQGLRIMSGIFGSELADKVLMRVGTVIDDFCKESYHSARLSSSSFGILMPNTTHDEGVAFVEQIIEECGQRNTEGFYMPLVYGIAVKHEITQDVEIVYTDSMSGLEKARVMMSTEDFNLLIETIKSSLIDIGAETAERAHRLQVLGKQLGESLGLSEAELTRLSLFISVCDVGMIGMREGIIAKIGNLNNEEWEEYKLHAERGYSLAVQIPEFSSIAEDLLSHHERWDGLGFPNKQRGDSIPLLARIVAIIAAYDELVYRVRNQKPREVHEALNILKSRAGSRYDPDMTERFIEMINKMPKQ